MTTPHASPLANRLDALLDREPSDAGAVPTGFTELDDVLDGGLRPGSLVVVASRPGVGCSTLALDIARNAAFRCALPSVLVAPRTPTREVVDRVLAAQARVPITQLRRGQPVEESRRRLEAARSALLAAPLALSTEWEDPEAGAEPVDVLEHGRWDQCRVVVLDDLAGPLATRPGLVRGLADHARARRAVVVMVVALAPASDEVGTPRLEVLRACPGLAETADVVLTLYRPDVHDDSSPRAGEADLLVAKNRYGPMGTVTLLFQGHYARFVDMPH